MCHRRSGQTPRILTLRWIKNFPFPAPARAFVFLFLTNAGCTPKLKVFHVTIPSNTPASLSETASHQGSTHVCPGTEVQISWDVSGKASLSATEGELYQTPTCFNSRLPAKGTKVLVTKPGIASSCGNTAVLRLSAGHDLWHRSGYCPGTGCPGADHEIVVRSEAAESVGGKTNQCIDGGYELTNLKAEVDWDDHYRIVSVSVPPRIEAYLKSAGRHLAVSHDGKRAEFTGDTISSDAFEGEKFAGEWKLKLSGCGSPPPALVVTARLQCSK